MKAKEALLTTQLDNFNETEIYVFKLTPCNEGQEMGFLESYEGNIKDLFIRCDNIVKGLKSIFPSGEFSVLIANSTFDDCMFFVPTIGVLDKDGNLLLKF